MASARRGEAKTHIDAPSDAVWALLADVERMGEWSPECYRVEWLGGAKAPAVPGARFKGWNRYQNGRRLMKWAVTCEVTSATSGQELSWTTLHRNRPMARWTYRLDPANGGTDVTESFEVLWLPLLARLAEDRWMRDRDHRRQQAMEETLGRIKAVAEADRNGGSGTT